MIYFTDQSGRLETKDMVEVSIETPIAGVGFGHRMMINLLGKRNENSEKIYKYIYIYINSN